VRFELPLLPAPGPQQRPVPTGADQTTTLRLLGQVTFPAPLDVTVDVWWLQQYGGGLFLTWRPGRRGLCSCSGAPGSLVGTTFVIFESVRQECAMTTQNAPASTFPATGTATPAGPAPVLAPPSWAWRRGALILAGTAQLITISALLSADPLAVTWASLLLAIAPAPLAAAAAFTPAPVNRLAAVIAVLVLVA
jgi:hypothetical protein